MNWRLRAACIQAPPRMFDPVVGKAPTDADRARARHARATYCASCPVQLDCLADALDKGVRGGIRGGVLLEDSLLSKATAS
jgi:hypothetical protein